MLISGLYKFSTVNYPNKVSCVIFMKGCPCNCDYCYNRNLLRAPLIEEQEVLNFLSKRVGLLDAVVFSGGEPMYQMAELLEWCKKVKRLGFLIGLHTTGFNSDKEMFKEILGLCDWVGLDFKATKEKYEQVCGHSFEMFATALPIVLKCPTYEIRTTLSSLLNRNDLLEMRQYLNSNGVKDWYLQKELRNGSFIVPNFKLDIENIKVR